LLVLAKATTRRVRPLFPTPTTATDIRLFRLARFMLRKYRVRGSPGRQLLAHWRPFFLGRLRRPASNWNRGNPDERKPDVEAIETTESQDNPATGSRIETSITFCDRGFA
jgi:hypothetical protein